MIKIHLNSKFGNHLLIRFFFSRTRFNFFDILLVFKSVLDKEASSQASLRLGKEGPESSKMKGTFSSRLLELKRDILSFSLGWALSLFRA